MALEVPGDVICPSHAIAGYSCPNENKSYLLQLLTPAASSQHLLALLDDARILMFDKTHLATPLHTIQAGQQESMKALSNIENEKSAWIAASSAGYLAVWDARTNSTAPAMRLVGPSSAPYLSLASSNTYVAAGTELQGSDAYLDIWDLRQAGAPVRTYSEVHSDDITSLVYHPDESMHHGILLSGGMDGLVCATDTNISSEDDAVVSVGNTNASLARVGWAACPDSYTFTPRSSVVDVGMDEHEQALANSAHWNHLGPAYAISNMQTLSLWDADKVCMRDTAPADML